MNRTFSLFLLIHPTVLLTLTHRWLIGVRAQGWPGVLPEGWGDLEWSWVVFQESPGSIVSMTQYFRHGCGSWRNNRTPGPCEVTWSDEEWPWRVHYTQVSLIFYLIAVNKQLQLCFIKQNIWKLMYRICSGSNAWVNPEVYLLLSSVLTCVLPHRGIDSETCGIDSVMFGLCGKSPTIGTRNLKTFPVYNLNHNNSP